MNNELLFKTNPIKPNLARLWRVYPPSVLAGADSRIACPRLLLPCLYCRGLSGTQHFEFCVLVFRFTFFAFFLSVLRHPTYAIRYAHDAIRNSIIHAGSAENPLKSGLFLSFFGVFLDFSCVFFVIFCDFLWFFALF